jgi:hypothetical protein
MSEGSHPFPSRTRKLSPPEPMVLRGKPRGRVGRCRILFENPRCPRGNGGFLFSTHRISAVRCTAPPPEVASLGRQYNPGLGVPHAWILAECRGLDGGVVAGRLWWAPRGVDGRRARGERAGPGLQVPGRLLPGDHHVRGRALPRLHPLPALVSVAGAPCPRRLLALAIAVILLLWVPSVAMAALCLSLAPERLELMAVGAQGDAWTRADQALGVPSSGWLTPSKWRGDSAPGVHPTSLENA